MHAVAGGEEIERRLGDAHGRFDAHARTTSVVASDARNASTNAAHPMMENDVLSKGAGPTQSAAATGGMRRPEPLPVLLRRENRNPEPTRGFDPTDDRGDEGARPGDRRQQQTLLDADDDERRAPGDRESFHGGHPCPHLYVESARMGTRTRQALDSRGHAREAPSSTRAFGSISTNTTFRGTVGTARRRNADASPTASRK
jgi:hypothetical protein